MRQVAGPGPQDPLPALGRSDQGQAEDLGNLPDAEIMWVTWNLRRHGPTVPDL